ncbi:hypothetical protein P9112_006196 [Eukaryota sp. TZLM1-RC]
MEPLQLLNVFNYTITEEHVSFAVIILSAVFTTFLCSFTSKNTKEETSTEHLTVKDAAKFPFVAGAALVTLFLVIKFCSKIWVNRVLTAYFLIISCIALSSEMVRITSKLLSHRLPRLFSSRQVVIKFLFIHEEFPFSWALVIGLVPASVLGYFYITTKHWMLNNLFSFLFCIVASRQLTVGSFKTGFTLLTGLFLYDIFFVFKTPIMISVATNLDLPIKLTFPRYPLSYFSGVEGADRFSLLGNGDILVPALYLRLLSRFESIQGKKQFIYFSSLFAYACACVMAISVMLIYNHGQPVLLYIYICVVPVCLIVALCLGQFKYLIGFELKKDQEKKD